MTLGKVHMTTFTVLMLWVFLIVSFAYGLYITGEVWEMGWHRLALPAGICSMLAAVKVLAFLFVETEWEEEEEQEGDREDGGE